MTVVRLHPQVSDLFDEFWTIYPKHVGKALVRSEMETEITALFLARCDGPFAFSPTETEGGVFLALEDALALRSDPEARITPALRVALDEIARRAADGRLRTALEAL